MLPLRWIIVAASTLLLGSLAGCADEKTCPDFCGAGNTCIDGSCQPLACSPTCGAGTACQMGKCVAVEAVSCKPTCGPCQACDTAAAAPVCQDLCGVDAKCDTAKNQCVAKSTLACGTGTVESGGKCVPASTLACGEGTFESGGKCVPLKCEPACGAGKACEMGKCVAVAMLSCQPACAPCQTCDTSKEAAVCVDTCGANAKCDTDKKLCIADIDSLCGAGTVKLDGKCVPIKCEPTCGPGTACEMGKCVPVQAISCSPACGPCEACNTAQPVPQCVKLCGKNSVCDTAAKQCVSVTDLHRNAPELAGPFKSGYEVSAKCVGCHAKQADDFMGTIHWKWSGPTPQLMEADGVTLKNPGNLGKSKLINNFCVATPSNDKRCDQCHAGFGGDPDIAKPQKSARGYTKFVAGDATSDSSIPLNQRVDCLVCHSDPAAGYAKDPKNFGNPLGTLNLATAAQEIVMPTRTNCGACHFYAGGGDNVKLMGSSLKNPTEALDVHMGNGMACSNCHDDKNHQIKGAGIHVPANVKRASCNDCHGASPHSKLPSGGETLDNHTAKIACQTCHIPTFSRGQFGKMDWDWSTAGNNTKGTAGVVTTKVNDLGEPDAAGTAVTTYDYIKGNFKWMRNVTPAYAWYNGKMTHATTGDKVNFTGKGLSDADRISLGAPVGNVTDPASKIHPFKLMKGKQAVYLDGVNGFVIVPNVFGTGSLWGVIQAVGYLYGAQDTMDALWSVVFTKGAQTAGQIASTVTLGKFDAGTAKGWDWRYTKLYMDLNHEVAPKAKALGAGNACADCHSAKPKLPLCELYAGAKLPWGVTCP